MTEWPTLTVRSQSGGSEGSSAGRGSVHLGPGCCCPRLLASLPLGLLCVLSFNKLLSQKKKGSWWHLTNSSSNLRSSPMCPALYDKKDVVSPILQMMKLKPSESEGLSGSRRVNGEARIPG